ncbi:MAG TPA: putative sulfate exporter family transporter [Blastocatellia bacterium]|nr:putative sulfate exporter family transporter [Blastocatellia bacterium]
MLAALPVADLLGQWLLRLRGVDPAGKATPISGVTVAIILGILVRNLIRLPDAFQSGFQFCVKKLMRLGIILVGIKLSVLDVLKLGAWGIPVVIVGITTGLVFVTWFNRALRLPDKLGTLIAAGTGICGVTAIVSIAPAIKADDEEVAYAVANITVFGLLGMLVYPYVAPLLLHTSEQIGMFLGVAVHDTSQVIGAAMAYKEVFHDDKVLQAATVTKLTRNLFLAVVVPLLAFRQLRRESDQPSPGRIDFKKLLPLFILGFVAMAVVRSIGDATLRQGAAFGIRDDVAWKSLTTTVGEVWGARYLLGTAMAAVGLGTSFSVFKGVGLKPFAVGLVGAVLVGLVGFLMALLLGQFVRL